MNSTPERSGPQTAVVRLDDESALGPLAARLAAVLPARAFVALHGDLGAGKTTLVKAVAAAAGFDPTDVVSPTFGLIHEHRHDGVRLVHADMYRISGIGELHETGWEDAVAGPGWVFVEWPERIAAVLPADRLDVGITVASPTARTFAFASRGPGHDAVVAAVRGRFQAADVPSSAAHLTSRRTS